MQSPWPKLRKGASSPRGEKVLDCDEEGGARVSRRTRESPETRAGSGEPELENGVSKTYLRAPDHAKLGS